MIWKFIFQKKRWNVELCLYKLRQGIIFINLIIDKLSLFLFIWINIIIYSCNIIICFCRLSFCFENGKHLQNKMQLLSNNWFTIVLEKRWESWARVLFFISLVGFSDCFWWLLSQIAGAVTIFWILDFFSIYNIPLKMLKHRQSAKAIYSFSLRNKKSYSCVVFDFWGCRIVSWQLQFSVSSYLSCGNEKHLQKTMQTPT